LHGVVPPHRGRSHPAPFPRDQHGPRRRTRLGVGLLAREVRRPAWQPVARSPRPDLSCQEMSSYVEKAGSAAVSVLVASAASAARLAKAVSYSRRASSSAAGEKRTAKLSSDTTVTAPPRISNAVG